MVWVSLPWMNTAGGWEGVVRSELAPTRGRRGAPALPLPSSATRTSRAAMRPSREWARACRTASKRETEGGTGRAPLSGPAAPPPGGAARAREGGPPGGPPPAERGTAVSAVEVEEELVRVRPHLGRVDLGVHLVFDPLFDHVGGEHIALEQEVVVRFQGPERLLERPGRGRDAGEFLRGEGVDVLVQRLPRVDLVLDAVQAGHEHRGEGDVPVAGRVGRPELEPLGLRGGRIHRNPDGGGPVPARGRPDRKST